MESKWISVNDSKPKDLQTVAVLARQKRSHWKNALYENIAIFYAHPERWEIETVFISGAEWEVEDVVIEYWFPLPAAPKELQVEEEK